MVNRRIRSLMEVGQSMLTPEEFLNEWQNKHELVRFDVATVQATNIPLDAQVIFTNAGLPITPIGPRIDQIYASLPILGSVYTGDFLLPENCRKLRLFAAQISQSSLVGVLSFYCVSEPTGEVFCVGQWLNRTYRKMFMNASINQFAEFLLIHFRYLQWLDSHLSRDYPTSTRLPDDQAFKDYVSNMARGLRECDATACAEADHFLRTGAMFEGSPVPTQEWTETIINIEKMGYWY